MLKQLSIGAVLVLAVGCSSGTSKPTAAGSDTTTPSASTSATTPSASGAEGTLTIASFAYAPTPITASPGQKIAVTNKDSAEHTVTSDTAGQFLADDVAHGKTVTFTAPTTPGTYTFHCEYHKSMHGTLIVKA